MIKVEKTKTLDEGIKNLMRKCAKLDYERMSTRKQRVDRLF